MTEPKFTKGPWRSGSMTMTRKAWAHLNGGHELTIVQKNWDGYAADVIACVWSDDDSDERANARLIAAAPDMYGALEAARVTLEQVCEGQHEDNVCCHHLRAVNAALKKARGE